MMTPGVSFQPGSPDQTQNGGPKTNPSGSVQEAIKVLSLRLPKVVGAQALAPQALLGSAGSGGNPRVDSVVTGILRKMFPTESFDEPGGDPNAGAIPVLGQEQPGVSNTMPIPPTAPTFDGNVRGPMYRPPPQPPQTPTLTIPRFTPGGDVPDEPLVPPDTAPDVPDTAPNTQPAGNPFQWLMDFINQNNDSAPPPMI